MITLSCLITIQNSPKTTCLRKFERRHIGQKVIAFKFACSWTLKQFLMPMILNDTLEQKCRCVSFPNFSKFGQKAGWQGLGGALGAKWTLPGNYGHEAARESLANQVRNLCNMHTPTNTNTNAKYNHSHMNRTWREVTKKDRPKTNKLIADASPNSWQNITRKALQSLLVNPCSSYPFPVKSDFQSKYISLTFTKWAFYPPPISGLSAMIALFKLTFLMLLSRSWWWCWWWLWSCFYWGWWWSVYPPWLHHSCSVAHISYAS